MLEELLASLEERNGLRTHYWWYLSKAALELERADEFTAVARAATSSPWVESASAFAARDFERAAEILAAVEARPVEAATRRWAAEAHFAAGRRAEGEAELERALAFWRSVGATADVHEAQSLLAAAS